MHAGSRGKEYSRGDFGVKEIIDLCNVITFKFIIFLSNIIFAIFVEKSLDS